MEETKLHVSKQRKMQYVKTIRYHLPTKLLKLFLPSYSYLRYLYYMHKLLGPRDMLSKLSQWPCACACMSMHKIIALRMHL